MYFILGLLIGLIIGVIIGFGSVSLFRRAIIDSYRDYMNNKGNQFMNNLIKSFAKEFAEAGESTSLVDIAKNAYANAMGVTAGVTTGSTNKSEMDEKRERIKRSKRSNRNDNSDDSDDSDDEKSTDPALAAKINSDKLSSILEGSSEKQNNVKPDLDAKSDRVKTLVTEEKVIITD